MHDQMTLEAMGAATIRLVDCRWANYLQGALKQLRTIGQRARSDGSQALMKRFHQARPSTYQHSLRVARLARSTGRAFGFDDARLRQLSQTAVMHDVGKLFIPESILNRPRKPTRMELFILHKHPCFGALLASYFNLPAELRIRTQHHHERWDGKGYPHRLGGEDIPLMARIVQVSDTYDAMMAADRPYHKPSTHEEVVAELRKEEGKQFDPRIIEAFLDAFQTFSRRHEDD
ncbi:MAG: HD-GYP domain-containing protein [Pyrinomonadaceae bacterium]